MSTTARARAGNMTRVAQVVLAAAVAGGALVAVAGIPGMGKPEEPGALEIPKVVIEQLTQTRTDPARSPVSLWAVSDRLGAVRNHPKPVEAPPVAVAGPGEAPPPPAAEPEIRYLGIARVGAMVRALINDAGRQRFVKVGDTTALGQVLEIHDEYIMVGSDAASAKRIDLAARALAARNANRDKLAGQARQAPKPHVSDPASAATLAAAREMSEKSSRAQITAGNVGMEVRGGNFRQRPPGANPIGGLTARSVLDQRFEKQRREEIRAMLKSNNPGGFKNDSELNDMAEKILVEEMEAKRRGKEE